MRKILEGVVLRADLPDGSSQLVLQTSADTVTDFRVGCLVGSDLLGRRVRVTVDTMTEVVPPNLTGVEQVLVQCCDDCPCLIVDDKACSLMAPETEGTDRRERKFIVQHEIVIDTSEQVDPKCPLKAKHHMLMLSQTEKK